MTKTSRSLAVAATLALLAVDLPPMALATIGFVTPAHALVGAPLTPRSAAGVTRRTTRRVIRHTARFVPVLPPACVRTTVEGFVLWRCGGVYYRASGGRYVVVRID